jgi:transcriptional regulator with XRE-family HTH domain
MKTLLRNARENKGLGTREVAKLLKIDAALVSKFESGQRNPTKNQLRQFAELYDINLEELTLLWLKEKIIRTIDGEPLAVKALQAAQNELQPNSQPPAAAIEALFEEMDVLKSKLESLRQHPNG